MVKVLLMMKREFSFVKNIPPPSAIELSEGLGSQYHSPSPGPLGRTRGQGQITMLRGPRLTWVPEIMKKKETACMQQVGKIFDKFARTFISSLFVGSFVHLSPLRAIQLCMSPSQPGLMPSKPGRRTSQPSPVAQPAWQETQLASQASGPGPASQVSVPASKALSKGGRCSSPPPDTSQARGPESQPGLSPSQVSVPST